MKDKIFVKFISAFKFLIGFCAKPFLGKQTNSFLLNFSHLKVFNILLLLRKVEFLKWFAQNCQFWGHGLCWRQIQLGFYCGRAGSQFQNIGNKQGPGLNRWSNCQNYRDKISVLFCWENNSISVSGTDGPRFVPW